MACQMLQNQVVRTGIGKRRTAHLGASGIYGVTMKLALEINQHVQLNR